MPCLRCGCCLGNRRNDLTGKMIAESLRCFDVWVTTLTYDDARLREWDTDGANFRDPEHIKKFINNLRMQGERALGHRIELRYFAVYEKGTINGRGHWHVILFWCTEVDRQVLSSAAVVRAVEYNQAPAWMPDHVYEATLNRDEYLKRLENPDIVDLAGGSKMRQEWGAWRHGKVTVHALLRGRHKTMQIHSAVSYCVKYCLKERQRYLMSHGMGQAYYRALMEDIVAAGLQLNDLTYSFGGQEKLPMYNDRLKEKRAIETGGNYRAKPRRRVYQIQGVMRQRCIQYFIRLKRQKVKSFYRKKLAAEGDTVRDRLPEIKDALSLKKMGAAVENWQRQRERYRQFDDGEVLARVEERARVQDLVQAEIADELANVGYTGGYRQKNRVDGCSEAFLMPHKKGPAMLARERALMPNRQSKRLHHQRPSGDM